MSDGKVLVAYFSATGNTKRLAEYAAEAKKNGITKEEIAEIVTHAAFYCGWPKAWAVFRLAKDVWGE